MQFYKQARDSKATSTLASAPGVARVLASRRSSIASSRTPRACRRAAHPVSDVELASRLSFFLWSSIPDQTLMNLAVAGRCASRACWPRKCAG